MGPSSNPVALKSGITRLGDSHYITITSRLTQRLRNSLCDKENVKMFKTNLNLKICYLKKIDTLELILFTNH